MTRALLALAAVAGAVAGAWWWARARARAAPELEPLELEEVIRAASSADASPVARWRARVARAAEAYRAALEELTGAIPAWSEGPEALRVAGVFLDAATVEGASSLRWRAWFLPSSPAPGSRLAQDAGASAVELAQVAGEALARLRTAVALEPELAMPAELTRDAPPRTAPAELTPAESSAASSSSSSSSGSSSSSSSSGSRIRTNADAGNVASRSGIVPLPAGLLLAVLPP